MTGRQRGARHGRLGAFDQFMLAHRDMVYNVAFRILGDQTLAIKATESTFSRAFPILTELRGEATRLWLLQIVTGYCHAYLRQGLPSHQVRTKDDTDRENLLAIPAEQRIVLVLSDVQHLTYDEIASVTGFSAHVIPLLLSQGRRALRDVLVEQGEIVYGEQP